MKAGPRSLGLAAAAAASLTVPAYAHPFHGFHVSGSLHSLLHALDTAGFVLAGLTLLVVTVVTIRKSRTRTYDPEA